MHFVWTCDIVILTRLNPIKEENKMTDVYVDRIVCNCKQVRYSDIMKALHDGKNLEDVQEEFKRIQEMTKASTGCGGCYHKVLDIISQELSR